MGAITSGFQANADFSVSNFETVVLRANGLAESIADSFILIKPIMNTLLNYDKIEGFQNLMVYLLENILCYVGVVWIMSKIYLKGAIGTTINSSRGKENLSKKLNLSDFKTKGKSRSYRLKEKKILARTPIFLIQCFVMPIVYPILVFLIMAFFTNFAIRVGVDAIGEFYEKLERTSGQAIMIAIGQVFYMMNFCSIIAISKESKNAILTKYIPMKLTKQFHLKISLGILVNSISSILVTIGYYVCTKNIIYTVILFAILMLVNIIGEKVKLFIDLKNPQISWDNEYTMMKQNTNVMYELFYTLLVIGILWIISVAIKNIGLYLIFVLAISIIINTIINEYIFKKQDKIFRKVF